MFDRNPISLAVGICLATLPITVFSQESETEDMRIVITGSHIKRIEQESASPLATISKEDIALSGATTLGDLLQSTVYSNGASLNNQQTGGFSVGASNFNLRGLRADRTLILVDGKRLPSYPFAQNGNVAFTDLNIVPIAEIERVEILKDGASAVYGSDAIAGVVNIITRRDYDSSEITVRTAAAESGDYSSHYVSFLEGFVSQDTQVVFVGEFQDTDALTGSFSDATSTLDDTEISSFSFPGTYFTLDANSNLVAAPAPGCTRAIDAISLGAASGEACGFDWASERQLLPENKRFGLSLKLTQYFGDISVFADFAGSKTETRSDVPFGLVGNDFLVLDSAQFNPIGETMLFRRGFSEIGLQNITTEASNLRTRLGLAGEVSDFDFEFLYSYGRTDVDETFDEGWMSVTDRDALFAAIDAEEINPFLALTDTQIAQYTSTFASEGKSYQSQFSASLSGEVMELDAGSVYMAAGVELRREFVRSDSDQEILDGDVVGLGSAFAKGERNISASFAEFIVPATEKLEFNVSVRYDDYDDFGSVVNPKFSFKYAATDEVLLRASWGTGFRAPNLFELNSGDVVGAVGNIPVISTGNLALEAEESESFNIGVVYDNDDQFSISLDIWEIDVEDMITNLGVFTILTATDDAGDLVYEDLITFNTDGTIALVTDPFLNIDQQNTNGVDISASWKILEDLTWSMSASYLNEIEQNNVALSEVTELAGEYLFPKSRINTRVVWSHGDFQHTWSAYHLASHGTDTNQVSSYTKLDYQLNYQWQSHSFVFSIDNLLDREAPSNRPSAWPYYEQRMYSPLGRNYSLQWKFTY